MIASASAAAAQLRQRTFHQFKKAPRLTAAVETSLPWKRLGATIAIGSIVIVLNDIAGKPVENTFRLKLYSKFRKKTKRLKDSEGRSEADSWVDHVKAVEKIVLSRQDVGNFSIFDILSLPVNEIETRLRESDENRLQLLVELWESPEGISEADACFLCHGPFYHPLWPNLISPALKLRGVKWKPLGKRSREEVKLTNMKQFADLSER